MNHIRNINDPIELREMLAHELAEWQSAEWFTCGRAHRFHRLVRHLAHIAKLSVSAVMTDLREDAATILEDDESER